ncbi:MAG: ATP-binding cassette domain-containing protein [Clostridia bacterium]|nr:ATP-binding cassette domain-containing protein [Clostridia bacterium]
MIELVNVEKTYSSQKGDTTAIENINLSINDGDIYGIIGLSGAGKSTLVRCINLLEQPTKGSVIIDGEDLTKVSNKRLLQIRQNIGMVFQHFNLLQQRTVEDNVRFPLEIAKKHKSKEAKDRVAELLQLVGLSEKAKSYPAELSGGQKQRVAIARALATSPKYLLCDEATSALDPQTTESILELLKKINQSLGVTVIIITHEMKVIEKICTKVAVIDNSHIVEMGNVSDVFADPKSEIARQLIIPDLIRATAEKTGDIKLRLIFNGEETDKPLISALALDLGVSVNILYADTKHYNGKPYGHMVITFPDSDEAYKKVTTYLTNNHVAFKKEL